MTSTLQALLRSIIAFREEREWGQFHTPRNLAAALSVEASEIQELLLWKDEQEVASAVADTSFRSRLSHEIADVLIYSLLLADSAGIDPSKAVEEKLALNAEKYPVAKARGRATKYTEL